MRIRLKPAITVSNDPEGKYRLFAPDETKVERLIDGYTKQFSGIAALAALAVEPLALGDITAVRGLWLSASQDCIVKLNGAATGLQLRVAPTTTGDVRASLLIEADVTAVEVTAGAAAVDVIYCCWGDAVP